MGTHTSKIKDILFVSSESLDPPQLHAHRKYRPHKEVKIDYKSYIPRSDYKTDATEEQLQAHLQELQKKEQLLKQFKHYKEFDRIDFQRMNEQIAPFEYFSEECLKLLFVLTLGGSRFIAVQVLSDYFSVAAWRRLFWPCFLIIAPSSIYKMVFSPEYHIMNHEYFRLLP